MFPRTELNWQPRRMPVATLNLEVWNSFTSRFNQIFGEESFSNLLSVPRECFWVGFFFCISLFNNGHELAVWKYFMLKFMQSVLLYSS